MVRKRNMLPDVREKQRAEKFLAGERAAGQIPVLFLLRRRESERNFIVLCPPYPAETGRYVCKNRADVVYYRQELSKRR